MTQCVITEWMDGGPRLVIEHRAQLTEDFFSQDAGSVGPDAYELPVPFSEFDATPGAEAL